jgi:hypothetical protein
LKSAERAFFETFTRLPKPSTYRVEKQEIYLLTIFDRLALQRALHPSEDNQCFIVGSRIIELKGDR